MSAWLSQGAPGGWSGWLAVSAAPVRLGGPWTPWLQVVDQSAAPFVRWFVGGHTNCAFNELDRHVLMQRNSRSALTTTCTPPRRTAGTVHC